jgi:hypothetical protein
MRPGRDQLTLGIGRGFGVLWASFRRLSIRVQIWRCCRERAERNWPKAIYRVSHLTGPFILRSGRVAQEDFDKYRLESDPTLLEEVAGAMAGLIPPAVEILAGLELGSVPLATALSLETGLPVGAQALRESGALGRAGDLHRTAGGVGGSAPFGGGLHAAGPVPDDGARGVTRVGDP